VGGQLRFGSGEIDRRNQIVQARTPKKPQLNTFNARAGQLILAGHYVTFQTQMLMQPAIMCQVHVVKLAT